MINQNDCVIRQANVGDVAGVTAMMLKAAESPSSRMCPGGTTVTEDYYKNILAMNEYLKVLVYDNQVQAMLSCSTYIGEPRGWISYNVEHSFRYRDGFRIDGQSLMDYLIQDVIKYAQKTHFTSLIACVRDDNTSSVRVLKNAGFRTDGACAVNQALCREPQPAQNRRWILHINNPPDAEA